MDVRMVETAGHHVLTLGGVVDLAATPRLHDVLRRLAERGGAGAVDLTDVVVLDDAAQGLLLGAAARARADGRPLVIVAPDGPVRERLAATRLDRVVDVVATLRRPIADADDAVS